jgi:hypothetical protein
MPYKDPEKSKEYRKKYYEKNKEKILQQRDNWAKKNPEKDIKYRRISKWKTRGIIFSDYDLLYDIYTNTTHCDVCKIKFSEDKKRTNTTRCLDHDHTITDCENVRAIVCHSCNNKIKIKTPC